MPSKSTKQAHFMRAVANSPEFSKKVGVPTSVGKEFVRADKGRNLNEGGEMAESKKMVKKEVAFMKAKGAPKAMVKHEEAEVGMRKGGSCKGYAKGGGIESKGKTKGKIVRMAGGK